MCVRACVCGHKGFVDKESTHTHTHKYMERVCVTLHTRVCMWAVHLFPIPGDSFFFFWQEPQTQTHTRMREQKGGIKRQEARVSIHVLSAADASSQSCARCVGVAVE